MIIIEAYIYYYVKYLLIIFSNVLWSTLIILLRMLFVLYVAFCCGSRWGIFFR